MVFCRHIIPRQNHHLWQWESTDWMGSRKLQQAPKVRSLSFIIFNFKTQKLRLLLQQELFLVYEQHRWCRWPRLWRPVQDLWLQHGNFSSLLCCKMTCELVRSLINKVLLGSYAKLSTSNYYGSPVNTWCSVVTRCNV